MGMMESIDLNTLWSTVTIMMVGGHSVDDRILTPGIAVAFPSYFQVGAHTVLIIQQCTFKPTMLAIGTREQKCEPSSSSGRRHRPHASCRRTSTNTIT